MQRNVIYIVFFRFPEINMKAYGQNPWLVENLDDFNFLCCPECAYKSKDDKAFIEHAIEKHPKSKASVIFSPDFDVRTVTWGPGVCPLCDKGGLISESFQFGSNFQK